MYVAFSGYLVVGMCILIIDDAKFDSNRADIAAAMNNFNLYMEVTGAMLHDDVTYIEYI